MFQLTIAITGHVWPMSEVSIPGSVTSHELNWSAGAGYRKGLERQAHLCSFSFPMESHFAENLVFSNHSNTVLYFFCYLWSLSCLGGGGGVFFPQNMSVIIFQIFWSFCCQILTHYGTSFGIWGGVRRKLVQTLCQHYEISVSLLQLPWHIQAASSWSDGELLLGAEKLFGMR